MNGHNTGSGVYIMVGELENRVWGVGAVFNAGQAYACGSGIMQMNGGDVSWWCFGSCLSLLRSPCQSTGRLTKAHTRILSIRPSIHSFTPFIHPPIHPSTHPPITVLEFTDQHHPDAGGRVHVPGLWRHARGRLSLRALRRDAGTGGWVLHRLK
jgi:hypothetical protein